MPEIAAILQGNQRAGARMIRLLEQGTVEALTLLKQLYPHSGNAFIIGITGSPGVGKSTLIDDLITAFRKQSKRVAVIAVDPSSPFSGELFWAIGCECSAMQQTKTFLSVPWHQGGKQEVYPGPQKMQPL